MDTNGGTVHLVGAGPGDPDLITVRGKQLIEQADAIVYDALVNPLMLDWARPDAECIFVGKRAARHSCSQDHIEELLVSLARRGLEVVRLKGGDPFIFGRGGEEAATLAAAGIPFTVCPAVTAALAAATHAGVPLTHREHSTAVTFLSGHEDPRKDRPAVNWAAHARTGATLCLYMAMGRLGEICMELMSGGLPAHTPVAIVQWAATQQQRQVLSDLRHAASDAVEQGLGSPAIVIVGDVARLSRQLAWFRQSDLQPAGTGSE